MSGTPRQSRGRSSAWRAASFVSLSGILGSTIARSSSLALVPSRYRTLQRSTSAEAPRGRVTHGLSSRTGVCSEGEVTLFSPVRLTRHRRPRGKYCPPSIGGEGRVLRQMQFGVRQRPLLTLRAPFRHQSSPTLGPPSPSAHSARLPAGLARRRGPSRCPDVHQRILQVSSPRSCSVSGSLRRSRDPERQRQGSASLDEAVNSQAPQLFLLPHAARPTDCIRSVSSGSFL